MRTRDETGMIKRSLLLLLCTVIFVPSLMEVCLRWLDPWGANTYYGELDILKALYIADDKRGYTLPIGTIEFTRSGFYSDGGWTATMIADGRLVPDSATSDCAIAIVGDSLTFGHAVRDEDTFTNILAGQFHNVQFYNLGMNGYNAAQALATIDIVKANVYVYILISNDADPPLDINQLHLAGGELFQATKQYFYHWQKIQSRGNVALEADDVIMMPEWFEVTIADIDSRDDVLMFGFAGEALAEQVASNYPDIILIPHYMTGISKADPHPDPEGHERIAESIKPYVAALIQEVCEDIE
jgi:hypothetical protein